MSFEDEEEANNRRSLRQSYRDLKEQIQNSAQGIVLVSSKEFERHHSAINELFEKVDNVRELAIDAEALTGLAKVLMY